VDAGVGDMLGMTEDDGITEGETEGRMLGEGLIMGLSEGMGVRVAVGDGLTDCVGLAPTVLSPQAVASRQSVSAAAAMIAIFFITISFLAGPAVPRPVFEYSGAHAIVFTIDKKING